MALWVAGPAQAFAQERELPAFGMVGLARGQTAVLNLVLVGQSGVGCRVTASFVNASGEVFNDRAGNPVQQTFSLRDNVAAELRLGSADILADGESRKPTRVVLQGPPDDSTPSDCTCLVATREILNSNGRTSISDLAERPGGGGNPPPPPPCVQSTTPQR
jgi:hypothetical protein